jgi:hypothetical protein
VKYAVTPDGRYFVVRGRLWRKANPHVAEARRADLVDKLMTARRAVREARKAKDREAEAAAHKAVDEVKQALGERGPLWWDVARRISTGTWRKTRPMPTGMRVSLTPPMEDFEWQKRRSSTSTARSWIRWIFTQWHGTRP